MYIVALKYILYIINLPFMILKLQTYVQDLATNFINSNSKIGQSHLYELTEVNIVQ